MHYRRVIVPGGTYFFTVNLTNRSSNLLTDRVDLLRKAVGAVKLHHPFIIVAWVVLPEHMHTIWTMPENDGDYSTRWMLIKQRFSRAIEKWETVNPSRLRKGERGIWQRRFWEHCVKDENDLSRHVDYVHINPVKHGLVLRASDWPYSSIHRYISQGLLTHDWACEPDPITEGGERS